LKKEAEAPKLEQTEDESSEGKEKCTKIFKTFLSHIWAEKSCLVGYFSIFTSVMTIIAIA